MEEGEFGDWPVATNDLVAASAPRSLSKRALDPTSIRGNRSI